MGDSVDNTAEKLFRKIIGCLVEIKASVRKLSDSPGVQQGEIDRVSRNIETSRSALVELQNLFDRDESVPAGRPSDIALREKPEENATADATRPVIKTACIILAVLLLVSLGFTCWLNIHKNGEIELVRDEAALQRSELEAEIAALEDSSRCMAVTIDSLESVVVSLRKSENDLKSRNASLDSRWKSRFPVEITSMNVYGRKSKDSTGMLLGGVVSEKIRTVRPCVMASVREPKTVTLTFKMIQSSDQYKTYNRNGNTAGHFVESKTYKLSSGSNRLEGPFFTSTASFNFRGQCVFEVWYDDKCLYTRKYVFK